MLLNSLRPVASIMLDRDIRGNLIKSMPVVFTSILHSKEFANEVRQNQRIFKRGIKQNYLIGDNHLLK